jgi:hypothetical protein
VVGVFLEMSGDVNRRETIRSEKKKRERIEREEKAKDRKKEERRLHNKDMNYIHSSPHPTCLHYSIYFIIFLKNFYK